MHLFVYIYIETINVGPPSVPYVEAALFPNFSASTICDIHEFTIQSDCDLLIFNAYFLYLIYVFQSDGHLKNLIDYNEKRI